jgi:hypothetical protein
LSIFTNVQTAADVRKRNAHSMAFVRRFFGFSSLCASSCSLRTTLIFFQFQCTRSQCTSSIPLPLYETGSTCTLSMSRKERRTKIFMRGKKHFLLQFDYVSCATCSLISCCFAVCTAEILCACGRNEMQVDFKTKNSFFFAAFYGNENFFWLNTRALAVTLYISLGPLARRFS